MIKLDISEIKIEEPQMMQPKTRIKKKVLEPEIIKQEVPVKMEIQEIREQRKKAAPVVMV